MNQKKVLFVDDDKFLLDMYALKFSKANYEAKTADSGELALKILNEGFVPDILLVDIIMPGMDGLTFLEQVRNQKLATNVVVVLLTNQGEPDDINRARKLNADGYIVKATTIPSEVLGEVEKIYQNKHRGQ